MSPYNSTYRNLNCLLNFLAATLLAQISNAQSGPTTQSPDPVSPQSILPAPSQLPQPSAGIADAGGDYAVAKVGPHSCVWRNSAGQSVTAIATGMNYTPDGGQTWLPSNPSFVVSPNGPSFVANQIQDPTTLAANIATQGSVTVVTPDGVTLRSTPIAIALYDSASGLSVIVASITNSTGVLVDPQHVVYPHAFV